VYNLVHETQGVRRGEASGMRAFMLERKGGIRGVVTSLGTWVRQWLGKKKRCEELKLTNKDEGQVLSFPKEG